VIATGRTAEETTTHTRGSVRGAGGCGEALLNQSRFTGRVMCHRNSIAFRWFSRRLKRNAEHRRRLIMRYFIAWLLGVPISVLFIIWLIWG
jgi:hypothetical protein